MLNAVFQTLGFEIEKMTKEKTISFTIGNSNVFLFGFLMNPVKESAIFFILLTKLYTPSTLNIDFIEWHTQLIMCAVK